jgi:uncharacterized membrane protein YfcA
MGQDIQFIAQHYLWLFPLGIFAGAYGTLIGAGGGFVLVPTLLILYPDDPPETITSISLAVVFFNALSGSLVYARQQRIDYKSGTIFSLATIPGTILGALSTSQIARERFDALFGILMIAIATFLVMQTAKSKGAGREPRHRVPQAGFDMSMISRLSRSKLLFGVALSCILGYLSSFLGIGAGFISVPALIYLFDFPVHVATATSQFMLAVMALGGSATHIAAGLFHHGVRRTLTLAIGVILGAQIGARLSARMRGDWIVRSLAVTLALVGIRLIVSSW